MKLNCFDVHFVICCSKEWTFKSSEDHRDHTHEDSLLLVFEFNPLVFGRSIKNLELHFVKFKIRGGLLGILYLRILLLHTAAEYYCYFRDSTASYITLLLERFILLKKCFC